MDLPLKSPLELAGRLDLASAERMLLVDAPDSLREAALRVREGKSETRLVEGRAIRTVKDAYDAILLWREERVGSQSLLEGVARRVEPGGFVWAIVALKKVTGVATPGAHRLDLQDLLKAFPATNWSRDREARVSAWHVGYRFVRRAAP